MKNAFLFSAAVTAALLAFSPGAQARSHADFSIPSVQPQPALVTPADTFSLAVTGFNSAGGGSFLTPALTGTFGLTQTFAGTGATAGQTITVTSSESISGTTTTDTITISVPTNFAPTGTVVGSQATAVTAMQFEMGRGNAGTNTLDFSLPITSPVYSGSILYSGGTFALNATTNAVLTNNNRSFADIEGVNAGGSDLSALAIRSFTLTIAYSTVPEPSTYALCALGLVGFAGVVVRRRRQALA